MLPITWQLIGYGLLALLSSTVVLLFLGSYSRVETVQGQIEPDLGSAQIMPSRPGIVTDIRVREGDRVGRSSPLLSIRVEELDRNGGSGPAQVLAALGEQDSRLESQERSTIAGAKATERKLLAQVAGLRSEMAALDQQIATQRTLIAVALADYDRAREVAVRGFVSKRDLQTREETLLGRQQQLSAILETKANKVANVEQAARAIDEAQRAADAAAAGIAGNRASVAQRRYDVEASRGYTLTAPIDGVVTALTARVGQAVQGNSALMTIVPSRARLEARLFVPTMAAGFLSVGEEVRLQVDAFPFSRFGTVPAKISRISSAALDRPIGNGQSVPVYLVTATISDPSVYGFGRKHYLQPDMTLAARIVTEKRSLAEWLFEPILAVRRR